MFTNSLSTLKKLIRTQTFCVGSHNYVFQSIPRIEIDGDELGYDFDLQCYFWAITLQKTGLQKDEATSTVPVLSLSNSIYDQIMDSLDISTPNALMSPKIIASKAPAIKQYVDEEVQRLKKLIAVRI
jgi:hypothetical protein